MASRLRPDDVYSIRIARLGGGHERLRRGFRHASIQEAQRAATELRRSIASMATAPLALDTALLGKLLLVAGSLAVRR